MFKNKKESRRARVHDLPLHFKISFMPTEAITSHDCIHEAHHIKHRLYTLLHNTLDFHRLSSRESAWANMRPGSSQVDINEGISPWSRIEKCRKMVRESEYESCGIRDTTCIVRTDLIASSPRCQCRELLIQPNAPYHCTPTTLLP